ncbi:WG repeat-containing protein [Burkholderia pseudomallei]|uniref:WG repeat-containing protein n=1 Tax=Burkholderia pseudomallei TaxID=28450 RepID=UPI0012AECCD0|nr:WG repeat-containing protein [Burkholderia pseudomallei]
MTIRATRLIPTLIESLYMPFRSLFSLVVLGPLTALFISGCQTAAPLPPASFVQVLCINGRCGVVDQDGKQRVPFENGYRALFLSPDGRTALVSNGAGWELFDVASQSVTRKLPIDGDVKALDDPDDSGERMDLVAFQRGGKWGLMDFEGKERQAPQFDDVSMLGLGHSTIAYAIGDRWGLLNAKGQRVTEAVYLDYPLIMVSDDAGKETGLILASTGGQSWLIQLQDGQRHPVAFSDVNYVGDGHWEVSHGDGENRRAGLMDATGRLVIDMKYRWLGNSGNGLIAFPTKGGELCGYLDYQGQTVIAPQFSSCGPFGKRGALAAEAKSGEWGFIDRHGDWREPPSYDFGGDSLTFSTVSSVADDTMQNVSIRSTEEAMVRSTSQGLRTVAKFIGGEASTKQRDALGRYMGRGDYSYGPVIDHDPNGLVVADVRSGIFDTD